MDTGYRAITVHVLLGKKVLWQTVACKGVNSEGNLVTFIPQGKSSLPSFYPNATRYEIHSKEGHEWLTIEQPNVDQLLIWNTALEANFLGIDGGDYVSGIAVKMLDPLPRLTIQLYFPAQVKLYEKILPPAMSWKPKTMEDLEGFKVVGIADSYRKIYIPQSKDLDHLYAIGWHMI